MLIELLNKSAKVWNQRGAQRVCVCVCMQAYQAGNVAYMLCGIHVMWHTCYVAYMLCGIHVMWQCQGDECLYSNMQCYSNVCVWVCVCVCVCVCVSWGSGAQSSYGNYAHNCDEVFQLYVCTCIVIGVNHSQCGTQFVCTCVVRRVNHGQCGTQYVCRCVVIRVNHSQCGTQWSTLGAVGLRDGRLCNSECTWWVLCNGKKKGWHMVDSGFRSDQTFRKTKKMRSKKEKKRKKTFSNKIAANLLRSFIGGLSLIQI